MITVQSLSLKDYVVFKKATIDFNNSGLNLILGVNKDAKTDETITDTGISTNKNQSNGSGKSLLLASLATLFYGTPPLSNKKNQRKDVLTTASSIEAVLLCDQDNQSQNTTFKVQQSLSKYTIYKDDQDMQVRTIERSRQIIANLFPLSETDFYSYVYLSTQRPLSFLYESDTKRSEIISDLFRFGVYDQLKEHFQNKTRSLRTDASLLDDVIADKLKVQKLAKQNQWNSADESKIDELQNSKEKLTSSQLFLAQQHSVIKHSAQDMSELKTYLESKLSVLNHFNSLVEKYPELLSAPRPELLKSLQKEHTYREAMSAYTEQKNTFANKSMQLAEKALTCTKAYLEADKSKATVSKVFKVLPELLSSENNNSIIYLNASDPNFDINRLTDFQDSIIDTETMYGHKKQDLTIIATAVKAFMGELRDQFNTLNTLYRDYIQNALELYTSIHTGLKPLLKSSLKLASNNTEYKFSVLFPVYRDNKSNMVKYSDNTLLDESLDEVVEAFNNSKTFVHNVTVFVNIDDNNTYLEVQRKEAFLHNLLQNLTKSIRTLENSNNKSNNKHTHNNGGIDSDTESNTARCPTCGYEMALSNLTSMLESYQLEHNVVVFLLKLVDCCKKAESIERAINKLIDCVEVSCIQFSKKTKGVIPVTKFPKNIFDLIALESDLLVKSFKPLIAKSVHVSTVSDALSKLSQVINTCVNQHAKLPTKPCVLNNESDVDLSTVSENDITDMILTLETLRRSTNTYNSVIKSNTLFGKALQAIFDLIQEDSIINSAYFNKLKAKWLRLTNKYAEYNNIRAFKDVTNTKVFDHYISFFEYFDKLVKDELACSKVTLLKIEKDLAQKLNSKNSHKLYMTRYKELKAKQVDLENKVKNRAVLESLVAAYSGKGLRNIALSQVTVMLQQNLNMFTKLLFGENMSFSITATKSGVTTQVTRPNGKVSDIRLLSGSESNCFSLIFLLSVLAMIPTARRTNFVVLDEMDSHMDSICRDRFFNNYLPVLKTVVSNVFVITPNRVLVDVIDTVFDRTITVTKQSGVSTVKVKNMVSDV